ncbi:MAG: hypothetical protein JGK04_22160 [Microcoleus sp. PH2017_39_LGB_O_B]|uniref:hypothetical protein n=1 Tax=unclassified Microcoleus TaxID=2642155 RepID=UPI001DD9E965|nr:MULTISPECIES: hypothetical protein [unclassified Microcoleus]MCC3450109.1 hypothetical protein [Microcoleus sp. PH2017_09_SFU_O_A]MCC3631051.1 hypothetical protein [Microcoleus sp. PH2017_39_LGB_O_B]MCC3643274.1 hypothetical protein [Microcoleus sp. PH2017_33_LGB_O_A]TAF87398.1 MAG: hypothetical protein EAZ49_20295 [Oscillatoriales cyanobacterium]
MKTLDSIQPLQLNELLNIDEIDPISEQDEACLDEIRLVLEKHGRLSKFGIALLHNHFLLEEDEVLVEYCDTEKRILTSKPTKRQELANKDTIETLWKFDLASNGGQKNKYCVKECPRDTNGRHYGYKEHYPGEE